MQYRRPESVLVIVATAANDVLLLRRRDPPGYWQSVTGSLDWGETADAAARRELREETGIDAEPHATGLVNEFEIVPPWTAKFAPGTKTNREHVYFIRLDAPVDIELRDDEHVEYRWLPARDAVRLASSSTNRDALRRLVGGC